MADPLTPPRTHGSYNNPLSRVAVVTPVLDDWSSFGILAERIAALFPIDQVKIDLIAVDDGSAISLDPATLRLSNPGCLQSIEVLRLALNLGHQRAIAVGLVEIVGRAAHDAIIVMDSDGEDRPEDVEALLQAHREDNKIIILAQRIKRSEPREFQIGYLIYKTLFRVLTGSRIRFGNFCLIPMAAAQRVVYMSELWNHLAAAIMRSRLPYREIPTARGHRYDGRSRMNWISLIVHGLSAISVYTDVIFARGLIAAAGLISFAIGGSLIAVGMRILTSLATPGWATTVTGSMLILFMQTLVLLVVMSLIVLSGRSSIPMVPKTDCSRFIIGRHLMLLPPKDPHNAH